MGRPEEDYVKITNLEVFANHGVLQTERKNGQKFYFDVTFELDTWRAAIVENKDARPDRALFRTVNYAEACMKIDEYEKTHTVGLIETAAENLARYLLHEYEGVVKSVTVEIRKPNAPIPKILDHPSVRITRSWHEAYISLGSNLGDREQYLCGALKLLTDEPDIIVEEASKIIETEPYGPVKQGNFLNACAHLRTICEPEELLSIMQNIENMAGRKREVHWGPRTLDLDLLFYDDIIMGTDFLCIPHPEMEKRSFVLDPLAEIAPYLRHPISKKTILQMKQELEKE